MTIGLTETQQVTNLLCICWINNSLMYQITLLLLGFLCQDVAVVSVMSLDLTCTGETKSLLCTGICLLFWHFFINLKLLLLILWQRIYQDVTHMLFHSYQSSLLSLSFFKMSAPFFALSKSPPPAGLLSSTLDVFILFCFASASLRSRSNFC